MITFLSVIGAISLGLLALFGVCLTFEWWEEVRKKWSNWRAVQSKNEELQARVLVLEEENSLLRSVHPHRSPAGE